MLSNHTLMEMLIENKVFQYVRCIKDNKLYVYNVHDNPRFIEDDYSVIKCFLVKESGDPDFSAKVEIYGKDLVAEESY